MLEADPVEHGSEYWEDRATQAALERIALETENEQLAARVAELEAAAVSNAI